MKISSYFSGITRNARSIAGLIGNKTAAAAKAGLKGIRYIDSFTTKIAPSLVFMKEAIYLRKYPELTIGLLQLSKGLATLLSTASLFPDFGQQTPLDKGSFSLLETTLSIAIVLELYAAAHLLIKNRGFPENSLTDMSIGQIFNSKIRSQLETIEINLSTISRIGQLFNKQGISAVGFAIGELAFALSLINHRKGPQVLAVPIATGAMQMLRSIYMNYSFQELNGGGTSPSPTSPEGQTDEIIASPPPAASPSATLELDEGIVSPPPAPSPSMTEGLPLEEIAEYYRSSGLAVDPRDFMYVVP